MKNAGTAVTKVRKSTKGVPRITDKVVSMSEADRGKWYDESCKALSAEVKAEVMARLVKAITEGRKPKSVNFATIFTGRSAAELMEAQTALTAALEVAAIEGITQQERIIEKANRELAALKAAAAAKPHKQGATA